MLRCENKSINSIISFLRYFVEQKEDCLLGSIYIPAEWNGTEAPILPREGKRLETSRCSVVYSRSFA